MADVCGNVCDIHGSVSLKKLFLVSALALWALWAIAYGRGRCVLTTVLVYAHLRDTMMPGTHRRSRSRNAELAPQTLGAGLDSTTSYDEISAGSSNNPSTSNRHSASFSAFVVAPDGSLVTHEGLSPLVWGRPRSAMLMPSKSSALLSGNSSSSSLDSSQGTSASPIVQAAAAFAGPEHQIATTGAVNTPNGSRKKHRRNRSFVATTSASFAASLDNLGQLADLTSQSQARAHEPTPQRTRAQTHGGGALPMAARAAEGAIYTPEHTNGFADFVPPYGVAASQIQSTSNGMSENLIGATLDSNLPQGVNMNAHVAKHTQVQPHVAEVTTGYGQPQMFSQTAQNVTHLTNSQNNSAFFGGDNYNDSMYVHPGMSPSLSINTAASSSSKASSVGKYVFDDLPRILSKATLGGPGKTNSKKKHSAKTLNSPSSSSPLSQTMVGASSILSTGHKKRSAVTTKKLIKFLFVLFVVSVISYTFIAIQSMVRNAQKPTVVTSTGVVKTNSEIIKDSEPNTVDDDMTKNSDPTIPFESIKSNSGQSAEINHGVPLDTKLNGNELENSSEEKDEKYIYRGIYGRSLESKPVYVEGTRSIPRNIFQTSKDMKEVSDGNFKSLNPTYYTKMFSDEQADDLVKNNFPKKVYDAYRFLPKPVLRADYFRYIVLYLFGGVYSDTDTVCQKPFDSWITPNDDVELIAGIEMDQTENEEWYLTNFARQFQILQWTLISRPFHPILAIVIDRIAEMTPRMNLLFNILGEADRYKMILDWTGPGIYTDAVLDYISGRKIIDPSRYYDLSGFPSYEEVHDMATRLTEIKTEMMATKNEPNNEKIQAEFASLSRSIYRATRIKITYDKEFMSKLHDVASKDVPAMFNKVMITPRYYMSPGNEDELQDSRIVHLFRGSWKGNSLW